MYFLAWSDLISSVLESLQTFMYSICSFIYELIIHLYDLFDMLCHGRIMDNTIMQQISFRVGLVLGLFMFFRVVFAFIQYLINPDTVNDKEKGAFNLVKKLVIVIVLLGTYSYMFDLAFRVQNVLLGDNSDNANVISRLLLPEVVDTENFGGAFSANLFMSFYTMNDGLIPEESRDMPEYIRCRNYRSFLQNEIINYNEFYLGYNCLGGDNVITVTSKTSGEQESVPLINFNYILAVAVGLFVCWALLMYCFSVGVRIIQLAFLEIIAPMPIISYISPQKDGMFQKWFKMCTTTYLDVFIRVAIINFIVLIIANIVNGFETSSGVFWESMLSYKGAAFVSDSMNFLKIIIILALLQFAKKAPELIKELLPKSMTASGDFGFGLKNRDVLGKAFAVAGGVAAGSAVGLISGVAGGKGISRLTGAVGGILGGAARGINTGVHAKGAGLGDITKSIGDVRKKQADVGMRRAEAIAGGSTFLGRTTASFQKSLGISTAGDIDARNLQYYDEYNKLQDQIEGYAENQGEVKKLKRKYEQIKSAGRQIVNYDAAGNAIYESDDVYNTRLEAARATYKNAMEAVVTAAMRGEDQFSYHVVNSDGTEALNATDISFTVKDNTVVQSIKAGQSHLQTLMSNHSNLFGDSTKYKTVVDFKTMDSNTNQSKADAATLTSTVRYARNAANNKFSSKK